MKNITTPSTALDRANILLGKELFVVKASLDLYGLIGLNASRISVGKTALGHVQNLSLMHVALGLAKIFERQKQGKPPLASISGVYALALHVPIKNASALSVYTRTFGVESTGNWVRDCETINATLHPILKPHLRKVFRARHTRIAHLQKNAHAIDLPSIEAFQELLGIGVAFNAFISEAFVVASPHPILADRKVALNFAQLLQASGLENVIVKFPD